MIETNPRAITVRPKSLEHDNVVAPIQSGDGDLEAKQNEEEEAAVAGKTEQMEDQLEWQEVANKV